MAEKGFFTRIGERVDQFRENLSLRFNRARTGLVSRFDEIRANVKTKLQEVGTRVAVWGFDHLVEPHQQRIAQILTIPASIAESRALGAIGKASHYEGLARIAAKETPGSQVPEWMQAEAAWLREKGREARKKAAELVRKAAEKRGRVSDAFARARSAVDLYQATTAI